MPVFLRTLEYYQGLLFLTTNRIGVFDKAFKSRIHLAIHYPALDAPKRKELWRFFLGRIGDGTALRLLDQANLLDAIIDEPINGRQIKNVVRTAHALATSQGKIVSLGELHIALRAMKRFDADFSEASRHREESLDGGCEGQLEHEQLEQQRKRRR